MHALTLIGTKTKETADFSEDENKINIFFHHVIGQY